MVNLIKTGISGLDSMLYRGIPEGSQVLISAVPGAGKTLLCFEYLYRNALMGNIGIFVALEEDPARLLSSAKATFETFKDIDQLIEQKKFTIVALDPSSKFHADRSNYEFNEFVSELKSLITDSKATRVVVDSVSVLKMLASDEVTYAKAIFLLISELRKMNVTSFFTMDSPNPERSKLEFKSDYFLFDGIITMYQSIDEEKRVHAIEVIKMRGSKHTFVTTPYEVTDSGFKIFAEDTSMY